MARIARSSRRWVAFAVHGSVHGGAVGPVGNCRRRATPVGSNAIQHVIIVLQSGHSFDNYFGTRPGVVGIPAGVCEPVATKSSACVAVPSQAGPGAGRTHGDGPGHEVGHRWRQDGRLRVEPNPTRRSDPSPWAISIAATSPSTGAWPTASPCSTSSLPHFGGAPSRTGSRPSRDRMPASHPTRHRRPVSMSQPCSISWTARISVGSSTCRAMTTERHRLPVRCRRTPCWQCLASCSLQPLLTASFRRITTTPTSSKERSLQFRSSPARPVRSALRKIRRSAKPSLNPSSTL